MDDNSSSTVSYSAATSITAATSESNKTYTSTTSDENAILIDTNETVVLTNPTVTKSGGPQMASDNYNFYGVNAAVLAMGGGTTSITGGTITSSGAGGNGIFSYGGNGGDNSASGDGTTVYVSDMTIQTSANGSGGIMTTGGGKTVAKNLTITTTGESSAPIRTDRGGGTVSVSGGTYTSSGLGSPAIYSTADITVEGAALTSNLSEGVCIEGRNSVVLNNCTLTASNTQTNGQAQFLDAVILYQSNSGDAADGTSTFSMSGGQLVNKSGHVFHVTNTPAVISLNGVTITDSGAGVLLSVCDDGWSGASNIATLNASGQTLDGDILVGSDSTLTLNLTDGSTFNGKVSGSITNNAGTTISSTVGTVNVSLDSSSKWYLEGDTYITSFEGTAANVITGNYNLYVNNSVLSGTSETDGSSTDTGVTIANPTGNTLINGTAYDDSITNSADNVTIDGAAGDDFITNSGTNVSISGSAGADSIGNDGASVTLNGGDGTTVYVNGTTIVTTGNGSGGIMTTGGGVTAATNLNVTTSGNSSAAIRSDRGGGTVLVSGGSYTSNGVGSPAIYSTAVIAVENATLTSTQSEGVCIEGLNSVALTNCTLNANNVTRNGQAQFLDGVNIYQSMSGDSASGTSTFSMTGGTLNNYSGHAFHVTNTNAVINLSGVTINNASGILLSVCDDGWSGASNVATINASGQALSGDILVGSDSGLTLNLTNGSTFAGSIGGTIYNASGNLISSTVGAVNLVLDATSYLSLTGDTYLTGFTGDASHVITNGHNLYVNNQLYGGTTDTLTASTVAASTGGLTFSSDGLTLTVDSTYAGTGVNLNDVPTVVNVDASNAGDFSTGFTLYGNSLNNNLVGSLNTSNTIWGGTGNNTMSAGAFLDTFFYTGGGNDVVYFTPNSDRLYLLTDITSVVSSGGNYELRTPTGNTLTLVTGSNSDYDQIFYTTDGNLKTAQIGDMNSTAIPYMGADFTALGQPGTLVVWGSADETFTLEDGSTYTFEGSNYDIRLDGSTGKTFVNVYNVDASNSFGNDIIFGDANPNIIIEGAGNNQLWGGTGLAADYLSGGTGVDKFLYGKGDGNDTIVNASIADSVIIYDATLSDIVSATEVEDVGNGTGTISLTFNTGNTLTIQGTDSMSAAINLADGSSWRYHRGTGSWQNA